MNANKEPKVQVNEKSKHSAEDLKKIELLSRKQLSIMHGGNKTEKEAKQYGYFYCEADMAI